MSKTILLGVLSDTHLDHLKECNDLAGQLMSGVFSHVDAILHAGDMVNQDLEMCFSPIPFISVRGNMDIHCPGVPVKRLIKFSDFRVGLIHSWGAPSEAPANAFNEFVEEGLDIIIFGHSHSPYLKMHGSTLLFNPGSATDHRGRAPQCSVGLIELGSKITSQHIFQSDWELGN